ncbi:MAG: ankyrin repeat domain-containing protein [Pleomorphochaeta sp.]
MTKSKDALNKELLDAAVNAKKAKEIKDLIAKGAEVNCVNEWGITPLLLAAQNNSAVAVLNALIKEGADLSVVDPEFKSSALHLAANNNTNPKILSTLVNNDCELEKKNYLGETPLLMAVKSNKETKIFTALIKEGADPYAKDYQGTSVLDYAKANKRTYIINSLSKLGIE